MTGHNNIHALLHCNIIIETKQNNVFLGELSTSSGYICLVYLFSDQCYTINILCYKSEGR